MKKDIIIFFLFCCFLQSGFSRENLPSLYRLKAQYVYGTIHQSKHLKEIVKDNITGIEIDYELLTDRADKNWHGYFNYPQIGVGSVFLNLGNDEILGNLIGLYPYLNFSLIDLSGFRLGLKTGAGASYLTKTFNDTKYFDEHGAVVLDKSNAAIGSKVNVYFAIGGNLLISLAKGFSITGEFNWNHASNGNVYTPNSGLNMLNTSVGIAYSPRYQDIYRPVKRQFVDLPRKTGMDIILSGGTRQLDYRDNSRFPAGSVIISIHRPVCNQIRLGVGLDFFYDGVYASVNSSPDPEENISKAKFTYLTSDKLINRFRGGISIQPEFVFGRMSAGFHFGLYLFNPIKNLEPYEDAKNGTPDKGLIYPYNIEKENGWLYTRASLKYLISDHVFLHLGLKTHLQKAEFIEWGIGYRL